MNTKCRSKSLVQKVYYIEMWYTEYMGTDQVQKHHLKDCIVYEYICLVTFGIVKIKSKIPHISSFSCGLRCCIQPEQTANW